MVDGAYGRVAAGGDFSESVLTRDARMRQNAISITD
jgi:hypothetical protein